MDIIKPAKNILIIDDDEHFSQILGRSLERFSNTTTYATYADGVMQKLDSVKFD
jgi:ActR/RegA family two-component response regulator